MSRSRKLSSRWSSDDSGSALVLALLVVLLVGALLAAVLEYARAGLTLAPAVKADRNQSNYVQGAVEGAINEIRGNSDSGRAGVDCPAFTPPSDIADLDGRTFRVTCEGQAVEALDDDGAAQPAFAIQELAPSPEGIILTGNAELAVAGPVYAEGQFKASKTGGGSDKQLMTVSGNAFFRGACTPTSKLVSPGGLVRCSFSGSPSLGQDPAWPSAVQSQTRLQSLITAEGADLQPTCDDAKETIDFQPGYYSIAPDLLVARYLPACAWRTLHFTPGFYYFDYAGAWDLGAARYPTGDTAPIKVVGGTAGAGLTGRALGEGCKPGEPGVQFVFGGDSLLRISGTASNSSAEGLELCAPTTEQNDSYASGFQQRISLFGATSGTASAASGSATFASNTLAIRPPTTGTTVSNADAARVIDEAPAVLTSIKGGTTTLALSDFSALSTIPAGAKITQVRVRTKQTEVSPTLPGDVTSTISFKAGPNSYPATPAPLAKPCPLTTPWCQVTVVPIGSPAPLWQDMASSEIVYAFKGPNGSTAAVALDGFQLLVDWTVPTLRPQSTSCNSSDCAFLATTNNARIYLHGTMYTPRARNDVRIHNDTDTVFARGVIVRTLHVEANASTKQETAPFRLPNATPGGRRVGFKGYVKKPGEPERLAVRACILYDDKAPLEGGETAGFPGWKVSVAKWSVLRTPVDRNSCTGVTGP